MTDELKEQLEDAAVATSKAYAHVRTLGTTETASESEILHLQGRTLVAKYFLNVTNLIFRSLFFKCQNQAVIF